MFVLITYDVNITSPNGAKRLRRGFKSLSGLWEKGSEFGV